MGFSVALLICASLGVVLPEKIFDPDYEGEDAIVNFRINETRKNPLLEWDFLDTQREYVYFEIILEPPFYFNENGEHESTSKTRFTLRLLTPYTQYNVTIKAFRDYKEVAVTETLTFKTKPTMPVIEVFKVSNWSHNENFTFQSDLVLSCYYEGEPSPNITLLHNGERIEPDEELGFLSLVYFNRSITRYGTYSCIATNVAGSVRKEFEHHYTEKDSDILIKTVLDLVDQTQERREEYDTRMTNMEETLNEMKHQMKEIKELLHNETEDG